MWLVTKLGVNYYVLLVNVLVSWIQNIHFKRTTTCNLVDKAFEKTKKSTKKKSCQYGTKYWYFSHISWNQNTENGQKPGFLYLIRILLNYKNTLFSCWACILSHWKIIKNYELYFEKKLTQIKAITEPDKSYV